MMKKKFIDRKTEWKSLQEEYEKDRASFVIVYGRRRVGKSTLLSEFCDGKKSIQFLAMEESETLNREAFAKTVGAQLDISILKEARFDRWEPIFLQIAEKISAEEKLILVMDEFQYLGKSNPAFPSVFMKIWDEILKDKNIMVILCGSLIQMMTAQTLNYGSPLYGRRTAQIRMGQIPYMYYGEFVPEKSEDERMQMYAVTGGVPKYIELFDVKTDIYTAIEQNIINANAFLYYEPEFLLEKEVSEIGSYFSLLRVIALGATKLSEISARLEVKQTSLSKYIKTLIELDILERQTPITEENPEKSKMGQYRIKDNYIRFWFAYVYPNRGMIETGHQEYAMERIRKHFIEGHMSYVYEDICREKIWEYASELPEFNRVGRWWNKNCEIDIVAYDSSGKDMIFGECKYTLQPKGMDVLAELKRKGKEVKRHIEDRKETYVLFSRAGYEKSLIEYANEHGEVLLK